MHLAYLDDSKIPGATAMFGAVVIPHSAFGWAERMHSTAIQQLLPPDEAEDFQEFHARDLFKGEGAFKGIDDEKRFSAITVLLAAMNSLELPFIYAALDERKLANSKMSQGLFETAHPLIPAFKMCALGIERWAQTHHAQNVPGTVRVDYGDQYLLIVDETKDVELKKALRKSYRSLRATRPYLPQHNNRLWHAHDAMYFGDSAESVGIQLADICAYFMQRHLLKRNPNDRDAGDSFYDMFSANAICANPEPEWTEYRELFMTHVGV